MVEALIKTKQGNECNAIKLLLSQREKKFAINVVRKVGDLIPHNVQYMQVVLGTVERGSTPLLCTAKNK